ncbi:STM3941 family protein [Mycolicibacter minnesotensis]
MPYEAHLDRRKIALLIALNVLIVLLGVSMTGGFGPVEPTRRWSPFALHVMGWALIIIVVWALVMTVPRLFQSGVEVRIDTEGVYGRRSRNPVIPWAAIDGIAMGGSGSARWICVLLKDPDSFVSRSRWWGRAFGDVAIPLGGTDANIAEVEAAIDRFAPERLSRRD